MYQFVPNFLGYFSAKYYVNWFTAEKVHKKKKGELFIETQCIISAATFGDKPHHKYTPGCTSKSCRCFEIC